MPAKRKSSRSSRRKVIKVKKKAASAASSPYLYDGSDVVTTVTSPFNQGDNLPGIPLKSLFFEKKVKNTASNFLANAYKGTTLPSLALCIGITMLTLTVGLSIYNEQTHWAFVSHMGAHKPAYYFYVMGCCICCGLLIPSAAIFFMYNNNKIMKITSDEHERGILLPLNKISFWTAVSGAIFFALQSVFPLVGVTSIFHGIFAGSFFFSIIIHSFVTSYLYYGLHLFCNHSPNHCICEKGSQFWLKLKIYSSILILTFNFIMLICVFLGYLFDPVYIELFFHFPLWHGIEDSGHLMNNQSVGHLLAVGGAICEYALVFLMILYFCSYLHDMKSIVVTVVDVVSVDGDNGNLVDHRVYCAGRKLKK